MEEDRIDRYCNHIHIACIGLQRLKRQQPYRDNLDFVELVERFCHQGRDLMHLIRWAEGQLTAGDPGSWMALS